MKTHLAIPAVIALLISTSQSFADVQVDLKNPALPALFVYGTISKSDGDYVAQHEAVLGSPFVYLNSEGGAVDAAMKIGRIIRNSEAYVNTQNNAKCFSSCALIYIAGVTRVNYGVIGLHRPYLGASLTREAVEHTVPRMLQRVKDYVREMGVGDAFYDAMVNTEVTDARLYYGDEIKKLVPVTDPTYDEIDNAYDARKYGVSAGEMRRRKSIAHQKCDSYVSYCWSATLWGLDTSTYERAVKNLPVCGLSDYEVKIFRATDPKKRRDLPFIIRQETCIRDGINKQTHGWAN